MKRILSIILITALLVLSGCHLSPQGSTYSSTKFYYLLREMDYNQPDSVVSFEKIQATNSTPEELMQQYLQGPTSQDLISPFPTGLELVSIEQEGNDVSITVSKEITELAGIDLTLACSCLAKTLENIIPAERYRILPSDGRFGSKSSIVVTADTFIWEDQTPIS